LLNGILVEELSCICHYSRAKQQGKDLVAKLVALIPRQQYVVRMDNFCLLINNLILILISKIAIQAAVGSTILARDNLKAYRKDVTAKLVRLNYCE
jgi:GTP-binding protein LepA